MWVTGVVDIEVWCVLCGGKKVYHSREWARSASSDLTIGDWNCKRMGYIMKVGGVLQQYSQLQACC